jgi:uncharacterized membrane protein YphA (DoxX/SURF4 family)/peroxiredoxin
VETLMSGVLVLARIALAGVFAVAGAAKLLDRQGARDALRGFGLPAALCAPLAVAVPIAELAIAAALLSGWSARSAALAAVGLLTVFSAGIGHALARGERVDCHCFGPLNQGPAGRGALVRNGIFAALALFIAVAPQAPGPAISAWLGERSDADRVAFWLGVALAAVVIGAGWFGRELLRQQGRLLLRLDALESARATGSGIPIGAPAPAFTLPSHDGGELTLEGLLALGRPALLVFSDARCGPCIEAVPLIARAQRHWRGRMSVALLSRGGTPASEVAWEEHRLEHVGIVDSYDLNLSYGATGTPAALLVSREGRIDSALVVGLPAVAELLATPVGHHEGAIGEPDARGDVELAVTQIAGGI